MAPYDTAGRIPKQALIVSCATLLAVSLLAILGRFYIRLRIQRQFSIDDGILIFGTCCMICSLGLTLTVIDTMYMVEVLTLGERVTFTIPPNFQATITHYRRVNIASLILTWITLTSVKFSFLALFRRLIDRIYPLILYWWAVVLFNAAISIYGATVPYLACPVTSSGESTRCLHNPGLSIGFGYALSQMVLDIVGDLLILVIPIRLIWQIQTRWTQKLALACSLCLTLIMIIITLIRASGLVWHGTLDQIWVVFWQTLASEVGLTLAAMSAFRALYVSRAKERRDRKAENITFGDHSKGILRRLRTPRTWYETTESEEGKSSDLRKCPSIQTEHKQGIELTPEVVAGRNSSDIATTQSIVTTGEHEVQWPLSNTSPPVQF